MDAQVGMFDRVCGANTNIVQNSVVDISVTSQESMVKKQNLFDMNNTYDLRDYKD